MGPNRSASPGRGPRTSRGAARRGAALRRWLPRAALGVGLITMTAGCDNKWENLGLRTPLTTQAGLIKSLWQGSWIAAFAVGLVVWGGIVWAVIFYRRRGDRLPDQVRYNLPVEILYTVIPFIMVGALFYFTARDENNINSLSHRPQVIVDVTGSQWTWTFQYPQYPVRNSPHGITETGAMWNGSLGKAGNYGKLPLLEIPAGETVQFNLTSVDVVHAFWVLPFDFKRDVIPGHPNHFQVTTTGTLYKGPDTLIRCSELCGLYHSRMLARLKIVTPAQFKAWISQQQHLQNASGGAQ